MLGEQAELMSKYKNLTHLVPYRVYLFNLATSNQKLGQHC